jgi:hypothetical protein
VAAESHVESFFQYCKKAWGKDIYKAWPRVAERMEHALWVCWNPAHGPLNEKQLEYAYSVLRWAVDKAAEQPTDQAKYQCFHGLIRVSLRSDKVVAGFRSRSDESEPILDVLEGVLG